MEIRGTNLEKIEKILTDCIQDIKSGKATLVECLDRYDSRRNELEPLIKMALSIQEPPAFTLDDSYKQAAKARLMYQIRDTSQKKSKSFIDILSLGIPPRLTWARVAMSVLVVLILMSMMVGGTAYAAQDSLPGDFLYPVKIRTEDARLLVAGGESAKARLTLKFAQTRLDEMNELTIIDPERAGLAIDGYKETLDAALHHIRQIADTSAQTNLLIQASEKMQYQLVFCDNVIDSNPGSSEPVNQASDAALNQQVQFLEMLSLQNNLKAAQINLDAMKNRIQRAQEKAVSNQYQTMQEVLLQYQQFSQLGENILQNAQVSNNNGVEIEVLSAQALSDYLDILDSISQQVPQQYHESIETCKQLTRQFEIQAHHAYQEQGNPDTGYEDGAKESVNGKGESGTSSGEPGSGAGEPDSGDGEPDSGAGEPGSGAGEPGSGAGEPGSGAGKPGSGNGETNNDTGNTGNGSGTSSQ